MGKRSLQIQKQHFQKAENAFISLGLTQNALATRLELSRSTISNFLRGKAIYKENFVSICETLKLDWQEITGLNPGRMGNVHPTESIDNQDINALVTQLRHQVKADIEERCGTMREVFKDWWRENGQAWIDDFRNAIITYRNIGHDWQFSEAQKTLLEQYYRANQLLTQCLNQECVVSPEVRQYIEETLLLPIDEIKPFAYNN